MRIVSLRIIGVQQLHWVKRMIGGIGNMLLSTYSQTENRKGPRVSLVNLSGASENSTWAFLAKQN